MNDDPVFQPGDKVVRVAGPKPGVPTTAAPASGYPDRGKVYCVEGFVSYPTMNYVMLVGFGGWHYTKHGQPFGWWAGAFRKVEEIKLCVEAVKHMPKTETVEAAR